MQREDKKKEKQDRINKKYRITKKYSKYLALLMVVSLSSNAFAEMYMVDKYFDDLRPEAHINKMFSSERKNELKGNVVNYDDIEDIIHLYNPEILSIWNEFENNKSASDIYEDYQDAADSLYAAASSQDSEMMEAITNAQASALQIQADKSASDSYTNFLTNYRTEKQLVLQTKILDINYHKSYYNMIIATESLNEAKRKEESATNALSVGSGTQIDLLTAKKAVVDANSALISATSNQKTYKRNLLVNCAKPMTDDVNIVPVVIEEFFDITSVDLNTDYQYALAHNIQLEIYRRKKENARTLEVKNEFQILCDAAPEKIYNDLENKYSNILDALDSVYNRDIAYTLAVDNLNKAQDEFSHGNISSKAYESAKYNLTTAENNRQIAKYDLKIAIENYNFAKMGYGDC